jgi:hypothetical protein
MMHISIPKPCHEDWKAMTPNEQGRHCNVCCKTVVDFTSMNDEEVKHFFFNKKKEESVCGRFRNEQLQRIKIELPYNIYTLSMPLWKQFLTVCLLAFSSMLFSCDAMVSNTTTIGDVIDMPTGVIAINPSQVSIDTTTQSTCTTLIGDTIAIQTIETITQGMSVMIPVEPEKEIPLMGEPAIQLPDTSQSISKGEIAVDTNTTINPKTIDTIKTNNQSPNCNNDFINL